MWIAAHTRLLAGCLVLAACDAARADAILQPPDSEEPLLFEEEKPFDPERLSVPRSSAPSTGYVEQQLLQLSPRLLKPMVESRPDARAAKPLMEQMIEQRNWGKAFALADRASEDAPRDVQLVQQAAALAALAGNYEKADEYFRLYLRQNRNDVPFLIGYANVLFQMRQHKVADRMVDKVLDLRPNHVQARYLKQVLALAMNRSPGAEVRMNWLQATAREKALCASWLSVDRRRFIEVLEEERYLTLCDLLVGEGSSESLELIPDTLKTADALFAEGAWKKMLLHVELARKYGVICAPLEQDAARAHMELGNLAEANKIMQRLVRLLPQDASTWYRYGYILTNSGSYQQAVAVLSRARKLAPEEGMIGFALACALAGNQELDRAWPLLQELVETDAKRMPAWLQGDQPYLLAIRRDPRYGALVAGLPR